MKRWLLGLLALLCMVSMVACSKSAPSLEGDWQAQDALKKDYRLSLRKISSRLVSRFITIQWMVRNLKLTLPIFR